MLSAAILKIRAYEDFLAQTDQGEEFRRWYQRETAAGRYGIGGTE